MKEENEAATEQCVEGKYANNFRIGHNAFEIVIDFGQQFENEENETIHTRIITSPYYASELLNVLSQAIESYKVNYNIFKEDE